MMSEYDLTIILLAETKEELLERISRWNKRCEEMARGEHEKI